MLLLVILCSPQSLARSLAEMINLQNQGQHEIIEPDFAQLSRISYGVEQLLRNLSSFWDFIGENLSNEIMHGFGSSK